MQKKFIRRSRCAQAAFIKSCGTVFQLMLFLSLFISSNVYSQTCTNANFNDLTVLNPSGGNTATNGLQIQITGVGNFQVLKNGVYQLYGSTISSGSPYNAANGSQGDGLLLFIGNKYYKIKSMTYDPISGYSQATSSLMNVVSNTCSTAGNTQALDIRLSAVAGGLTYYLNLKYSYTIPNNYLTVTYSIEIPSGSTAPVKLAHFLDGAQLLSADESGFVNGAAPYYTVGIGNTPQLYQAFKYNSGTQWSGYYAYGMSGVPGDLGGDAIFNNTIGPTQLTNSYGISLDFGTTPGTYTSTSDILFACNAPTTPPSFSNKAVCAGTSVDLTSLYTGPALGSNIALRYYDPSGNLIADPTNVTGAGNYTAEYVDTANQCNSPRATIKITNAACSDLGIIYGGVSSTCVKKGSTFTLTYTVNNSAGVANNPVTATLADVDPNSYIFQSYTATSGTYDNTTRKWTIPSLGINGASSTITLTYKVGQNPGNIQFIGNATVAGASTDANPANNTIDMTSVYVTPLDNITANNDAITAQPGNNVINVLTNDVLNGASPATLNSNSNTKVTMVSQSVPGALILNADGSVNIPSGTPAGVYTMDYSYCYYTTYGSTTNTCTNCTTARLTVTVTTSCYKPGAVATAGNPALISKVGISSLQRTAAQNSDNFPAVRQGAWLALEARTKGFVVNRIAFNASGNPIGIPPADFLEGMMVYDTTNKCLKMYTSQDGGTSFGWFCITTQTCPD
ncbi:DUF11 domain-containing protein [Chryseobacterium culicis]|uniref:DUF11 domain-containing protein n=1 Tax=Chryseobacterium culicis TaxID=680127 RepID=UPI0018743C50|nr:DUF11 domain-containing protein [Chryseobacterium culicis]MBE4949389.1 DUF11 domain-containing protein [Chryseobacterium culicis]